MDASEIIPILGLIFGGLFLILISSYFPDESIIIQTFNDEINQLMKNQNLCKDQQCVDNIEYTIKAKNLALSSYQLTQNIKSAFFFAGILTTVLGVIAGWKIF